MQATPDTPVSSAELGQFYGEEKNSYYADLIRETLTKTVRNVPHQVLGLPHISGATNKVVQLALTDAIPDACSFGKPLAALMAVFEKSDCPHVAALREAVAADYIYRNEDLLDL